MGGLKALLRVLDRCKEMTPDEAVGRTLSYILDGVSSNFFEGARILVTGGAGFIGSWLSEALVYLNAHIICLDNFSTGKIDNIKHLIWRKNFKLVKADVSKAKINEKIDVIIHGASIPSPDDYVRRPVEAMLPNSLGTLNVLEAARRYDSVVLYLSTSEVYGDAEIVPTPETYWGKVNPIGPRSPYDESKRFSEALCMAYESQYGLDVRIARIFNTYGPRIDPEAKYARVIPRFIMQALSNEPITVHGDGKQTRSFLYISDAIVALLKMVEVKKARGEVINIGNPEEISIIELARIIKKLTNSSSPIVHIPPRPDDPRRRCPDISKAKRLLQWWPKVSLEEGLKYTITWFKEVIKSGKR